MNLVVLIGRLTKDPEVRYSQSSNPMCIAAFDLAVDRLVKKEGQPEADFFAIKSFGKQAEFVEKYLHKGTKIAIQGNLQQERWDDKDGNKRSRVVVAANRVEFAESKNAEGRQEAKTAPKQKADPDDFMHIPEDIDEELPFN